MIGVDAVVDGVLLFAMSVDDDLSGVDAVVTAGVVGGGGCCCVGLFGVCFGVDGRRMIGNDGVLPPPPAARRCWKYDDDVDLIGVEVPRPVGFFEGVVASRMPLADEVRLLAFKILLGSLLPTAGEEDDNS